MYCDHIFIQILHDKLLLRTMKSPHREKKVDDIFFVFFKLWKLGTHHWVFTIALWVRLAGGWTVPALCSVTPGRFTDAAGQSLYNQTHSEGPVKLTHKKCNHTHTCTHALALGQHSHTWIVHSGWLHKRERGEAIQWHHLLAQAQRCPVIVSSDREVIPAGREREKKNSYQNLTVNILAEPAAVPSCDCPGLLQTIFTLLRWTSKLFSRHMQSDTDVCICEPAKGEKIWVVNAN